MPQHQFPEDPRYPAPPDLSPEEAIRRRAAARRVGLLIAFLCVLLAAVAAVVMLSLDPGDGGAAGTDRVVIAVLEDPINSAARFSESSHP